MDVITKSLHEDWYNPSSLYHPAQEVKKKLEDARSVIAKKINCSPEEIIFTSSGSEANSLALRCYMSLADKAHFILADPASHKSIIKNNYYWSLEVDNNGVIDSKSLENKLSNTRNIQSYKIVSVCGANNEIGTIQPIIKISDLCHKYDVIFHIDAVQLIADRKIDVKELGIDLMSVSGSKIGCPSGIGFLYVRNGVSVPPLIQGEQENGLRGGTENVPYILGLAKAVELLDYSKSSHLKSLRDYFVNKLLTLPNTYLVGASGNDRLSNNINICFHGIETESLLSYLNLYEIYASGGSACNSKNLEASHVLKAIRLVEDDLHSCIRFSLSEENTVDELEEAFEIIQRFVIRQNLYNGGDAS